MNRTWLNILFLTVICAFTLGTNWKTLTPDNPSGNGENVTKKAVSDSLVDWEAAHKPKYLIATGPDPTPVPPDPPTPHPTMPPCVCPTVSPASGVYGGIKCGNECEMTICTWNSPLASFKDCIEKHERSHLVDPNTICGSNGFTAFKNTKSQHEGECEAYRLAAECFYNIQLDPDDPNYDFIEAHKKSSMDQAKFHCAEAQLPIPTPYPTPAPPSP